MNSYQPDQFPVVFDQSEQQLKYINNGLANVPSQGGVTIPDTAYASNAEAVAALGVGKLYKSTVIINGSPQILYTV